MKLKRRRDVVVETMKAFMGHPFEWGKYDCGKMVIHHLQAMGRDLHLTAKDDWKTLRGLSGFLNRHGGSGAACLDGWGLPRIPPAKVWVGDIIEMKGDHEFGAFGIALDNGRGRLLGFHQDTDGLAVVQCLSYLNAWRV